MQFVIIDVHIIKMLLFLDMTRLSFATRRLVFNKFSIFLVDCKSVQKLSDSKIDGEYELQVFGHDNQITEVFIYCDSMHTDNPKEFISLPSGPDKNFVKIQKDSCIYDEGIDFF